MVEELFLQKIGLEIDGEKKNSGKIIFGQKSFGQNDFAVKNVLGKKRIVKKIWGQKNLFLSETKKMEITNFFGSKKCLGQKKIWIKKNFDKVFYQKNLLSLFFFVLPKKTFF